MTWAPPYLLYCAVDGGCDGGGSSADRDDGD